MSKKVTGVVSDWTDWTKWAFDAIVKPIRQSISGVAKAVHEYIFGPIAKKIKNLRIIKFAQLLNDPHEAIRNQIITHLKAEDFKLYQIFAVIRNSKAEGLVKMVDDYLTRLDAIKFAVEAMVGTRLPIIDGISSDIHTILGGKKAGVEFPASVLAFFDSTSGSFKNVLVELELISAQKSDPAHTFDLAPGHIYDWICCKTVVDQQATEVDKKAQQRLRLNMLKVILSYIDNVEINPNQFINRALAIKDSNQSHLTFGGFAHSSASLKSIGANSDGMLRAYAGIIAAAFEHIFVSSKPLACQDGTKPEDRYHDLPLSLKIQRPDLSKLAFSKPGYSAMGNAELEANAEFLAMKVAATTAKVTAGMTHKIINCICNGIWEVSPNNLPLVDTVASLVAIPIFELEKAVLYDVLRRFRVYVVNGTETSGGQFEIMRASLKVPNFTISDNTENQLTAVVAVTCQDKDLLSAATTVFGSLPVKLDADDQSQYQDNELVKLLHGTMKDALAVCYVATA